MKTEQLALINSLTQENLALKQQLADYRWLFNTSGIATKIIALDATYLDFNLAYRRLLGYSDDEVLTVFDVESVSAKIQPCGKSSVDKANEMIGLALETGRSEFEWMQKKQDGFEFLTHITLERIDYNGEVCIRSMINDVSQMRKLEVMVQDKTKELSSKNKELELLSFYDPLTNLYNRRKFEELLTISWEYSVRSNSLLAIVFLDIDNFKLFNDNYGHKAGDDCLQQVAKCIQKVAKRATDVIARYGGEEMIAVVSSNEIGNVENLATSIIEAVNQLQIPHEYSPVSENVTVSIGCAITTAGKECQEVGGLIEAADQMMYKAKENGKNRYQIVRLSAIE